jgi:ketosteroid isomerase-like protein
MHLLLVIVVAVMSPEQRDVWSGEQRYWDVRTAGKLEEFMRLWDDEFTGWPSYSKTPLSKADLRVEIENEIANTRQSSYRADLEPLSVRVHGDFAFVFYRVHATRTDASGKKIESIIRIHHSWRRTPAGWKIIAGMSASDKAK